MSDATALQPAIERPHTLAAAWCVAMLMVVGTAIQVLVAVSSDLYTGIAIIPGETALLITDIGPAGAAWLQATLILLAGAGLWLHGQLGGRICRTATLLVGLGVLIAVLRIPLWSPDHFLDLRTCTAWLSAACVALALAHLVQHEVIRRWVVGCLLAMAIPLVVDAAHYVFVQHARTVAEFEADRLGIFQRLNIPPDSPQAAMYERRLRFDDATGAFGLSNVLGTIMATLTLLSMGHVALAVRDRAWKAAALPLGMMLVAGFTLWLTRSRGAMVALAICLPAMLGVMLAWRFPKLRKLVPFGAFALVAVAVLVVLVRGWLGPPDTEAGERSLLFRYQYWTASADIYAAAPMAEKLIGVGPHGFIESYLVHKDPLNPEEVQSAHNVFVDWLTMLGIGGAAWSAVVLLWLWRSAAGAAKMVDEREPIDIARGLEIAPRDLLGATAVALLLLGSKAWLHWPKLTSDLIIAWVIATGAFVLVLALSVTPGVVQRRAARFGLFAAGLVLLVHAQIDMAFFTSGALAFSWLLIGVAGGAGDEVNRSEATPTKAVWPVAAGIGGVLLALAVAVFAAVPLTQQDRNLHEAALLQSQSPPRLLDAVAALQREADAGRPDPLTFRQLAGLQLQVAQTFAARRDAVQCKQWIDAAGVTLDRARAIGLTDVALLRAEANRLQFQGDIFNDEPSRRQAAQVYEQLLPRVPYSMQDRLQLADLYWTLGEHAKARQLYGRVMELNEQAYLDSLRQLPSEAVRLIRQRMGEPIP